MVVTGSAMLRTSFAMMLLCTFAPGCGSETAPKNASGAPMVTQSATTVVEGDLNNAPTIASLHFNPQRAAPGESVQAVAEARDPDGDPITLRYTWRVNGRRLVDTGPVIEVPESAVYGTIEVSVVASDGKDESPPELARFRAGNRAPRITALEIETIDYAGLHGREPHWRVVPEIVDADHNEVSVEYEWLVNDRVVERDRDVFAKSRVERGDEVRVRAVPFDGQARGPSLESSVFVVGNSPPVIVSAPPGLDASGRFHYEPEVEDEDRDTSFSFSLLESPETMSIDTQTGVVDWTPTAGDAGSHAVEIQVSDAQGGRSRQSFHVTVQVGGSPPPGPAARP